MRALRVLWVFAKLGFQNESAYRANFWIQIFESLLNVASAVGAISLVFARTDSLAGWRPSELVALLGVYFTVYGAIHVVIAPSLTKFMEDVRQGSLDFALTKPVDAQLLASTSEIRVWKLVDLGLGLAILAYGLAGLQRVTPAEAAGFALAFVAGAATVYGFWLILATCAFWFVRLDNVMQIFWSMYQAGRWPVGIYPRWLSLLLTVLVPVAIAVTVPAEALAGRLTARALVLACAVALATLAASRWFWKRGLRRYSGASA
ncbi:MAG TPA: ABC-2 family transporter protein [Myxococcota bacterium]|nr:ABC-2 family transporter protein [Myxococcota bacterium]